MMLLTQSTCAYGTLRDLLRNVERRLELHSHFFGCRSLLDPGLFFFVRRTSLSLAGEINPMRGGCTSTHFVNILQPRMSIAVLSKKMEGTDSYITFYSSVRLRRWPNPKAQLSLVCICLRPLDGPTYIHRTPKLCRLHTRVACGTGIRYRTSDCSLEGKPRAMRKM